METSPDSGRTGLTPAQARRFRIIRGALIGCIAGSALFIAAGVALFFLSGASTLARALVWGIFFEPGRLLPRRCGSCGVRL